MKYIYSVLVLILLNLQFTHAQVGIFDFESAVLNTNIVNQVVEDVTISVVSPGGNIDVSDWGNWGGTTSRTVYTNSASTSMTLSFDNTVTISSLRMADIVSAEETYLLTPTPNNGTVTVTIPSGEGILINLGEEFENITAITITQELGAPTYFLIDDVVLQSVLPVELSSFSASASNINITLNWETQTEINNYGFEIERASLGTTPGQGGWEKIGFVNGSGNSNSPKYYTFTDDNPPVGDLQYRLKQIDTDGNFQYYSTIAEVKFGITDANGSKNRVPVEFALDQNYPNPFNPTTKIQYAVSSGSIGNNSQSSEQLVTLKVYDILGNEVTTLVNEHKAPGYYEVEFSAGSLATGVYIYRLTAGEFTTTKKLMLMK